MNVNKSMLKVDLAKSLGAQYSKMASVAEKDRLRQEGAVDALKEAAKAVGDLGLKLDRAFKDGELTAEMLKDPKQVEIFIKKWNRRAVGAIDNLATAAGIAIQVAAGRMKGLQQAEAVVQKSAEEELAKLRELQRQIESGELKVEDVQDREAPLPLKYQREDEGVAEVEVEKVSKAKRAKPRKGSSKKGK